MKKYSQKGNSIEYGAVRIQTLSDSLVRIEQKGVNGFENRNTYMVVDRDWSNEKPYCFESGEYLIIVAGNYRVKVPHLPQSIDGVIVESMPACEELHCCTSNPKVLNELKFLPAPGDMPKAFAIPDSPRIVPPKWGALPPPNKELKNAGWDIESAAPDVYIFVPGAGAHKRFRADFLKLTGPVPMPPLYTFGVIDSRYYPYSEESALAVIDQYRQRKIPLDMFVVDTDWRIGASHGYEVDKNLFPDMKRFVDRAHSKNVKLMFNDHPEPLKDKCLDYEEFSYRQKSLESILKLGVDMWWFDRNWHVLPKAPVDQITPSAWGMMLYHDIIQNYNPNGRPTLMSNVEGLRNGRLQEASHPASHRYPIWWSGDTYGKDEFLKFAVQNTVNGGFLFMMPYINDDLGGHYCIPTREFYTRFMQFGCLSPETRPHSRLERQPWAFGTEVEKISKDYIELRYRLLPVLYSAARQAYEDGTPLLRRCDYYWPEQTAAQDSLQYLLGDDILVAPIVETKADWKPVTSELLKCESGLGLNAEYYSKMNFEGEIMESRVDQSIDFEWKGKAPWNLETLAKDFSVEWTGTIGPITQDNFVLGYTVNDIAEIYIDGQKIFDSVAYWRSVTLESEFPLEKGKSYDIKIRLQNTGDFKIRGNNAVSKLLYYIKDPSNRQRTLWIPPGEWQDLWKGDIIIGPQQITTEVAIDEMPLYVRSGGVVPTIPVMQYTSEKSWQEMTLDAFLPSGTGVFKQERTIYEDDGSSIGYKTDKYTKTKVIFERSNQISLKIKAGKGEFKGTIKNRTWTIRLHLPAGQNELKLTYQAGMNIKTRYYKTQAEKQMPFTSQNWIANKSKGKVLEMTIDKHPTNKDIELKFEG